LDAKNKLQQEISSIGIVLCKAKNNSVVEFAIKILIKLWVWLLKKHQNNA